MKLLRNHTGLFTDHYELTMAQAYFFEGKKDHQATFDYFFRTAPFNGSYVVFAGLYDLLEALQTFKYDTSDIDFLASLGFKKEFLNYLKDFRFSGSVYSVEEGEVVFPNEPILRVEGNIIECQLIETLLLNLLNFESLIATKASRVKFAAKDKKLIEFGLRRAQGVAGLQASKAAIIGGFDSTSNVYSAFLYGLTSSGTQAHSFIQSYDKQIDAFRAFASLYPENSILLVDTYDTIGMGVPDAITVAKEMEQRGQKLSGIRIDSGDNLQMSKQARKMLDEAGLNYVKIVASNQLDEFSIKKLMDENAPIDSFGVGTSVITGKEDAALDGVYKLSMADFKPRLKVSEEREKTLLPGVKKVFRFTDSKGMFVADGILPEQEKSIDTLEYLTDPTETTSVKQYSKELLLKKVMANGEIKILDKSLKDIAAYVRKRLNQLGDEYKQLENPKRYKVGVSSELKLLQSVLINKIKNNESITNS